MKRPELESWGDDTDVQTTTEASDEMLIREQQDPRDCENL